MSLFGERFGVWRGQMGFNVNFSFLSPKWHKPAVGLYRLLSSWYIFRLKSFRRFVDVATEEKKTSMYMGYAAILTSWCPSPTGFHTRLLIVALTRLFPAEWKVAACKRLRLCRQHISYSRNLLYRSTFCLFYVVERANEWENCQQCSDPTVY